MKLCLFIAISSAINAYGKRTIVYSFAQVFLLSGSSHKIIVENQCIDTVWLGTLPNGGVSFRPLDGGAEIPPNTHINFEVPRKWAGRFWGRTGCVGSRCETGDCGGVPKCRKGAGGQTPATLAEFTFDGFGNLDYYDVSLVDGYNLPISIVPIAGTFTPSQAKNEYYCTAAGCTSDLNANCPPELQKKIDGRVVACLSACEAFGSKPEVGDAYCCRGTHSRPETCRSADWPVNYPAEYFKPACPGAYSYAYDDAKSTFTCRGEATGYRILFCAGNSGQESRAQAAKLLPTVRLWNHYRKIRVLSAVECASTCASEEKCRAMTFNANVRVNANCWLFGDRFRQTSEGEEWISWKKNQ